MMAVIPTDRLRGALRGLFVGDALAMPVHWYYDVAALRRDFGTIRDYQVSKDVHPSPSWPWSARPGPGAVHRKAKWSVG